MVGRLPASGLAPHEYRYALDAAMSIITHGCAPVVLCNAPWLVSEIRQRIPDWAESTNTTSALWVEPLVANWQCDSQRLGDLLPVGGTVVVIASRPLARALPEHRSLHEPPDQQPLGAWPRGVSRIQRALTDEGFLIEASYGVHSVSAIGLNLVSKLAERWGHPELADRLHFASRMQYCITGPFVTLATVALLVARKQSSR